jgi:SPP1 family predicted phage head-tail adaptor
MVACCDITASKLRNLITIEKLALTTDGQGGWTEVWTADPVGGVYAWIKDGSGSEQLEAERKTSNNFRTAIIRFRGNAAGAPYYEATTFRIVFQERYYNITSVQDMEMAGRWLRMLMVEGDAS